jgi:nucleoside-diphosphate-sugar epimerase
VNGELVLVTGGSGFVGAHCLVRLLKAGYRVRASVRSPGRESDVRAMVAAGGAESGPNLNFAVADLTSDAGWPEAMAGCDRVLHVASPFPAGRPEHDDDVIVPARDGTLRVLRAARDAGAKRVVMTSSFAAIGYGHPRTSQPFAEDAWTEPAGQSAYVRSKTLAERAAWDFISREGGGLELAVINPTGIFGPVLGSDYSGSIGIVKALLDGAMPRVPRISFGIADVRDVAQLHVQAMADPAARGERFIVCNGDIMSLHQVALTLKARLPEHAQRVPAKEAPDWLVRLAGRFNSRAAAVTPDLGQVRRPSNAKARHVFGWEPRSNEETIVTTAESLIQFGLLEEGRTAALYGYRCDLREQARRLPPCPPRAAAARRRRPASGGPPPGTGAAA